jgi:hypothetical protein
MAVCGVMVVLDGVSVGAGNLGHLPLNAAAGLAATLGALCAGGENLSSVWWALLAFYLTRTAGHALFYALTWRRSVFAGGTAWAVLSQRRRCDAVVAPLCSDTSVEVLSF